MLTFFFNLYRSLMRGDWLEIGWQDVWSRYQYLGNKIANWLLNALGGNFETLQTMTLMGDVTQTGVTNGFYIDSLIPCILALITFIGVVFATWKVVKSIFSIFFYGWR